LVFQRRSAAKDTHPRALDAAVTGHLRAGESVADALREAEEEIGLRVQASDLWPIGRSRRMDRTKPGIVANEVQAIFMVKDPVDSAALRPSPAEIEALVALPLASAPKVLCGGGEALGMRLSGEGGAFVWEPIRAADFVPAQDGYYEKAFESVAVVIGGGR